MSADTNEMTFLNELGKYENQWVALIVSDDSEVIVGSGDDAVLAKRSAEANGYQEAILYKVQSFDLGYIPCV
jgi:hypothetical protein